MNMKPWMKVTCAAALASSACTQSQVASDADIMVSGQVLQENQQPLANTLLTISRSANSACVFTLIFGDSEWKSVKTGTDGSFSQTWLGADTKNGNIARCFSLQVPGGSKGSYVNAQFSVQSDQVQIPTLQQWSGAPAAAATTNGVNVSFKNVSETQPDVGTTHPLIHVQDAGGRTAWTQDAPFVPTLLNDDILEDGHGLTAFISVSRSVTTGKNSFDIYQQSDSVALPTRTEVPLSRGASCTYPEAPTPCLLTDGDLTLPVSFKEGTRQVVIQLDKAQVLRKAILRNLEVTAGLKPQGLVLEGSTDGTTWVTLANLLDDSASVRPFIEASLSTSTPVSQVRLTLSDSGSITLLGLSELSLF